MVKVKKKSICVLWNLSVLVILSQSLGRHLSKGNNVTDRPLCSHSRLAATNTTTIPPPALNLNRGKPPSRVLYELRRLNIKPQRRHSRVWGGVHKRVQFLTCLFLLPIEQTDISAFPLDDLCALASVNICSEKAH